MNREIRVLILAAGASQRLGRPKATLPLATGETLLERAVATARGAGLEALVAVPPGESAAAREAARLGAASVVVPDAHLGMSASIRAGIGRLKADPAVEGVLILLADQWRVTPHDLAALVAAWEASATGMAAARYSGKLGVPAVFGRVHFGLLCGLEGDRGARDLLRGRAGEVAAVDLPHAGVDLDTPAEIPNAARG